MSRPNILKNQKGILTLDFMFAFVLVLGFTSILFSFAMTFSVVEVVQYISFSAARNYSLAHLNEDRQRERAQQKMDQLLNNNGIRPLLNNGWFEVRPGAIDDFNDEFNPNPGSDSDIFIGVRIPFSAPILFKRIPFVGSTGDDPGAFSANVQSFLAREPHFEECKQFMEQRKSAMQNLYGSFDPNKVALIMDNGC